MDMSFLNGADDLIEDRATHQPTCIRLLSGDEVYGWLIIPAEIAAAPRKITEMESSMCRVRLQPEYR